VSVYIISTADKMARPKRRLHPVKKSPKKPKGDFYEGGDKFKVWEKNANRRKEKAKLNPLVEGEKDKTQQRTECKRVIQKACQATKGHRDNDRRKNYAGRGWMGPSVKKCRKFLRTKEKPIVACKPVKKKKSKTFQSSVIQYKGYTLKSKKRKRA